MGLVPHCLPGTAYTQSCLVCTCLSCRWRPSLRQVHTRQLWVCLNHSTMFLPRVGNPWARWVRLASWIWTRSTDERLLSCEAIVKTHVALLSCFELKEYCLSPENSKSKIKIRLNFISTVLEFVLDIRHPRAQKNQSSHGEDSEVKVEPLNDI